MESLTLSEARRREACEIDISKGGEQIVNGLKVMRDDKLFRSTHETFEAYCEGRWKMSRRHVNRLIQHGDVLANLEPGPNGSRKPPITERAARAIANLTPAEQREIVAKATENGQKPTAKAVQAARQEIAPKEEAAPDSEIVNDSLERPVPKKYRVAYANGQRMKSIARRIDAIKRDLEQVTSEPGGEVLAGQIADIRSSLMGAKDEAMSCAYWTCCPQCDGKPDGCKRCKDRGWMPERWKGTLSAADKETLGVA